MKTDRLTLLISPGEKEALAAKAAQLGITSSELVRRAALEFDPEREAQLAQLGWVTGELAQAVARLRPKLDRAFAEAERTRDEVANRARAVEAATAALEADTQIDWPGIQALFGVGQAGDGLSVEADSIAPSSSPPNRGARTTIVLARLGRHRVDADRGQRRHARRAAATKARS